MQVQLQEDFFKTFPNQDRIKLLNWFNVWFLGVAASVPPTSTSAWLYCWQILSQKTLSREYNTTIRIDPLNSYIELKNSNKKSSILFFCPLFFRNTCVVTYVLLRTYVFTIYYFVHLMLTLNGSPDKLLLWSCGGSFLRSLSLTFFILLLVNFFTYICL